MSLATISKVRGADLPADIANVYSFFGAPRGAGIGFVWQAVQVHGVIYRATWFAGYFPGQSTCSAGTRRDAIQKLRSGA